MKKTKVFALGAVALGVAALPVVGTFATNVTGPYTDKLSVEIKDTCTFQRALKSATVSSSNNITNHPTGTWGTSSGTAYDTVEKTITNGGGSTDVGSSKFYVTCNNLKGWQVKGAATALTSGTQSISVGIPGSNVSAWSWTPTTDGTDADYYIAGAVNGTTIENDTAKMVVKMTKATTTAGKNFTVAYAASATTSQAAGTYTGTIEYDFAKL